MGRFGRMAFSKTAEYALRAMAELVRADASLPSESLAERIQVPAAYLSKILRQLTRAGFLVAVRGKNGGCRLSDAGRAASVYDVMLAVDPPRRVCACPLGLEEHRGNLCPMHAKIESAFAALESTLRGARVGELADRSISCESLLRSSRSAAARAGSPDPHRRGRRPEKTA